MIAAGAARPPLASWRGWLGALAACTAAFAVVAAASPSVPIVVEGPWALADYLLGFAFVSGAALVTGARAPAWSTRGLWLLVPAGLALAVVAAGQVRSSVGPLGIAAAGLVLASLLVAGNVVGAVLGGRVQAAGHLSVVAVVSSLADVWSVTAPEGPSGAVAASVPLLSVLALPFPMLGTDAIEPLLGVGDVVFVSLYLAVSRRFSLGVGRTAVALGLGLAATALLVVALERALPALPALGLAVLVAHPEARLPPPSERRQAGWALAVFVALFAVLVLLR